MPSPSAQQRLASDPARSVWVAANAGSGKTTVLVNRVVRLLLAGADPARVLCVTFTKAAAANMQNRIFDRLGGWAALPDDALADEIAEMTGEAPAASALLAARRLFARAVETPGGLKIQTIHSFCERLLHLFPFEAAVPARFEMLDDVLAGAAMERAVNSVWRQGLADPGGAMGAALRLAADAAGEDGVREALRAFIAHRRGMERPAPEAKFAASPLRQALGLAPRETLEDVRTRFFGEGFSDADRHGIAVWLDGGGKTDRERADDLRRAVVSPDPDAYASIFLTAEAAPRKALASKALAKARPDLLDALLREQERVHDLVDRLRSVAAAMRTEAIVRLADEALVRYEAEKRRLGRLDFQDLIGKTRALLTSDAARWVRYKLDQSVDHILVDEAQDTSPAQWDIIAAMSDDFFAGEGARGHAERTIFAVGDEKQSIFGFQGARPEAFAASRRRYERLITAYNDSAAPPHDFATVPLLTSYRTTDDILSAVDQVFSSPETYTGLESDPRKTVHGTNRTNAPGLVELWPPEAPAEAEADPDAPLDARPPDFPTARLADRIARRIRFWIDSDARFAADGEPITPGDVLVLVRSRGPIFDDVIKALTRRRVPVAGADRMRLLDQIAVMDLLALGRFCLLPEDDLSLAAVLRSPLVGLTEEQLLEAAAARGDISLWSALRRRAPGMAAFADAVARLDDWRQMAASLDPLRFYGQLLSSGGARRLLAARLGPDAAEAIDVFLYRLRQWQAANPPSLRLFVEAMAGDESDVKRDMEEAHGRVRVMTVHGSKGLEAKVVFLVDLFKPPGGPKGPRLIELVPGRAETAVWIPRKGEDPRALAAGRGHLEAQDEAEHRRLLYVALTRARDRLYLAGAASGKTVAGHWHGMIEAALGGHTKLAVVPDEAGEGEVRQWRTVVAPPAPHAAVPAPEAPPAPFPWLRRAISAELPRPPPMRPSRLADSAEPPPMRDATARRSQQRLRGELIHLLFQHLPDAPAARRESVGAALAEARFGGLEADVRKAALDSALALLADPRWSALFGREGRAEAEIAGRITLAGRVVDVAGRIDRLLIAPESVTVLDYKTGRPPADARAVPEGHLRQLAVYRALARDLYPDRRVEAAVLWTALPEIVVLDDVALDAAMQRIAAG